MKQILQNLKTGKTEVVDVPYPQIKTGHLLIQTRASLISAGTERMLIDFGKANYLQKAKQQPDKVRQVLDKIRTDGLMPTIEAVRSKLDQPILLGYCNAGTVQRSEVRGQRSDCYKAGDRVVSNGPHAEVVCVSKNLCAKIPDEISDEEAAFTVVGAIGLQGIRLAEPTLGECFVVTGLGLIGLLTVQILQVNGCRVLGIDLDPAKCALARQFGADVVDLSRKEDPVSSAMTFSSGRGVDGVLITAATKSSGPVHQAAQMCRKRGRIVLVGVTGLELNRADFYEKELSFQVSCSYGPGRYDPEYEEKGHDYPLGFVRWTEQRNFGAVLDLMAAGKIDVKPLITDRFKFEDAEKAYELIGGNKEPYVGIILKYNSKITPVRSSSFMGQAQITQKDEGTEDRDQRSEVRSQRTVRLQENSEPRATSYGLPVIGLIGAGNFTGQVLLPALRKTGARLKAIASSGGVTGTYLGKKFGFEESTTDVERIFEDKEINTVFVTTRHNTHARFVMQGLQARKNVFVEKPLCLMIEELEEIELAADIRRQTQTDKDFPSADSAEKNMSSQPTNSQLDQSTNRPIFMVGFNRRFAPHVVKMKELLETMREPKSMIMTVNAGMIPEDHWTQDVEVGGGRIIGEACHFIDLLRFLAGEKIVKYDKAVMQSPAGDTLSINLSFADGSIGTVHYFANGNKSFPKERLEVFYREKILQLDNFKVLRGYGWKGFRKMKLWRQDKGHAAEIRSFVDAVANGKPSPIPFEEIVEVTKVSLGLSFKA